MSAQTNLRRYAESEFHRRINLFEENQSQGEPPEDSALLKRLDEHWFSGLRILARYPGNRLMALDCFFLAHGLGEMIGTHSAVELSIRHFGTAKKKWTIGKCIKLFQDALNLPAVSGQRGESGRRAMGNARKNQLTTIP